ncbi:unnamed protein product, partial [Didymodactylos carnosus]
IPSTTIHKFKFLALNQVRTAQATAHLRSTSSDSFLNTLLPTTDAFEYHCKRVGVQVLIWFQSLFNNIEYPPLIGNGYTSVDGETIVEWKSTASMPDTSIMITCGCKTRCSTKKCKCFKHQLKCTILCKCESCENTHVHDQPSSSSNSSRKDANIDEDRFENDFSTNIDSNLNDVLSDEDETRVDEEDDNDEVIRYSIRSESLKLLKGLNGG